MKVEDPKTGKLLSATRKTYKLKMKAGTTGTTEDPHRPEIADLLKGKAHDWSVNRSKGIISVACQNKDHQILAQTQAIDNG